MSRHKYAPSRTGGKVIRIDWGPMLFIQRGSVRDSKVTLVQIIDKGGKTRSKIQLSYRLRLMLGVIRKGGKNSSEGNERIRRGTIYTFLLHSKNLDFDPLGRKES